MMLKSFLFCSLCFSVCMQSSDGSNEPFGNTIPDLSQTTSNPLICTIIAVRNLQTGEFVLNFSNKPLGVLNREEAERLGLRRHEADYVRKLYDAGCSPEEVFYGQKIYDLEKSGMTRSDAIAAIRKLK